ncbi:long-chain fatty acid--CoA ligase, partial [Rhodopseudomonas sp. BR0C11]|uniref:AMP-binding enzyme n=1 Tax=Rhodopseudomonas sp. BR0C11 TaxID=2269370 RepID=UPI0013E081A7
PMYLADIREALGVMGQRFVQIYGQGESPMTITSLKRALHADVDHPRYLQRLASVGTAQSVVSVRITGANGEVLPPGETGEIEVKGSTVMLGYWNNPQANAETLKDGWLRTGDVGRLDEDGFLTLSDRSKDVIISGGTNIYPREVEEALLTHPAVREVSAIGVADPEWGENVVACVVLADGAAADDATLDAHCLATIARFKRPKRYVYLDALPKNNYGKVLKTELRKIVK